MDDFPACKKHLTPINFISSMNSKFYNFLSRSELSVPSLNQDEIYGFHIWNTVFEREGVDLESIICGFYYDIKMAILESDSTEEYYSKLSTIFSV